jgi:AbrB family looped-hinge helix DNA binding protein
VDDIGVSCFRLTISVKPVYSFEQMQTADQGQHSLRHVTLSAKGQLVIPKKIRRALALEPGAKLEVGGIGQQIWLKPVATLIEFEARLDELCGRLAATDALAM